MDKTDQSQYNANRSVDKSPERIAAMFDRIAPRYDFLNHLLSANIDRFWRRKTVRRLLARFHDRALEGPILDVATGTGDLAIALADGLRRGKFTVPDGMIPITATDFSAEMLKIGENKAFGRGLSGQIAFRQADTLALPFVENTFSAVTVAFGIRNMADTDRALAEMVRVCRSGGWIAILEFSMPKLPILSSLYSFYFRKVLPRIGKRFSSRHDDSYAYLPASVIHFDRPEVMRGRMARAGLAEIESISLTFGVATLYLGRKSQESAAAGKVD